MSEFSPPYFISLSLLPGIMSPTNHLACKALFKALLCMSGLWRRWGGGSRAQTETFMLQVKKIYI